MAAKFLASVCFLTIIVVAAEAACIRIVERFC